MMKNLIACASALALVAACGVDKDATAALEAMKITDGKSGLIQFSAKTASGKKVTLKDVVLGAETGTGIKAATLVLDGLDMSADGKPMVSSVTLSNLTPQQETPGISASLATLSMTATNEATSSFIASTFGSEGPPAPPAFEAWGLGNVSLKGLTIKGDLAQAGMGGGSFNVTMDEMSVANLDKTIFGGAKLSGLKGDFDIPAEAGTGFPVKGTFDFGNLDIKNLRGGLFATAFQAGLEAASNPAAATDIQRQFYAQLTSPIDPGFDSATWSGLNFIASGLTVKSSKADTKVTRNNEGVATAISSPRFTFTVETNAAEGQLGSRASMGLGMIGYQTIEIYGESDATFDPMTDTTRYNKYNFGLTDGFDLSMAGGVQGLKPALEAFMGSIDAMQGGGAVQPDFSGFELLKIVDLDLSLTDKSLVNRLFNLYAQTSGGDAEQIRTDIINMLSANGADLSAAGVDSAISSELTAAVAAFVKQPGTLTIKMKPAAPVALAAPGVTLTKEALNLSIVHTPGAN